MEAPIRHQRTHREQPHIRVCFLPYVLCKSLKQTTIIGTRDHDHAD